MKQQLDSRGALLTINRSGHRGPLRSTFAQQAIADYFHESGPRARVTVPGSYVSDEPPSC